ncbi:MAG: hypothetical protein AAGI15_01220 [Pseudomonadota bacterium]
MEDLLLDALPDLIATLIGVAIGGLGALLAGRAAERRRRRGRATTVLRTLKQEMMSCYQILTVVRDAGAQPQGQMNFYLSTSAWETANGGGDLPEIIGYRLAAAIERHYSMIFHLRHYVMQQSALDLSPPDNPNLRKLRSSYAAIIHQGVEAAMRNHPAAIAEIEEALGAVAPEASAGPQQR